MWGSSHPSLRKRAVITMLSVVLAAVAYAVWSGFVAPHFGPKRFGTVIEGALYRSGRIQPTLLPDVLDEYRINDIVTLTYASNNPAYQRFEENLSSIHGIGFQRFPMNGNGTGDPAQVVAALLAIHDAIGRGERVLVQCAAGSERSGAVVYLYRTLVLGDSPDDAYAELLHYGHRPAANPDLEAFLNANMAYFADALAAHGIVRPRQSPLPKLPELHRT